MNLLIINFFLTLIIELIVFILVFRKNYLRLIIYVLLINLFTWPIANLVYAFWPNLIIIELAVVLIESFLIKILLETSYKKALIISFIANFISFLAGML